MVCVFVKKKLIMKSFLFIFIYKGKLIAITLWNIFYFFVVQFLNKNFHYKGFDSIEGKKFFRCLFFFFKKRSFIMDFICDFSREQRIIEEETTMVSHSDREQSNVTYILYTRNDKSWVSTLKQFRFSLFFFFVNEISISW